jgi:hypothetical protein
VVFLLVPLLMQHAQKRVTPPLTPARTSERVPTTALLMSVRFFCVLSAQFVPLSDIWGSDPSGNYRKLVAHCDLSCVRFVCDIKEAGGDQYYRFSENRTLTWLSAKVRAHGCRWTCVGVLRPEPFFQVERLLSAKHPLASAVELVAQYAPKQFEQQLDSVYGCANLLMARA